MRSKEDGQECICIQSVEWFVQFDANGMTIWDTDSLNETHLQHNITCIFNIGY